MFIAALVQLGIPRYVLDEVCMIPGKTLQTLCVIAHSHKQYNSQSAKSYSQSASIISQSAKSLIICPKTLVAHWLAECGKYFGEDSDLLRGINLQNGVGNMAARIKQGNLIVTSYENVRRLGCVFCLFSGYSTKGNLRSRKENKIMNDF